MIWVKNHKSVLAACDEKHLGRYYEEGKLQLDVKEAFYKGKLISEEEFGGMLPHNNVNLIGENCIRIAKEKLLIGEVKKIKGVPYAMIFRL